MLKEEVEVVCAALFGVTRAGGTISGGAVSPLTHFPHAVIEPEKKLAYAYVRYYEHTHEPSFTLRWRDKKGQHEKKFEPVLPR